MSLRKLPKWIELSIRNHFLAHAEIVDYSDWEEGNTTWPMIFGGIYKKVPNVNNLELRFDGPYINEVSRGIFDVETEVNVLITAYESETSSILISDAAGILAEQFTSIILKKWGDGEDVIGCLNLKTKVPPTKGDRLEIRRFQQIHKDKPIEQAIVEGHYLAQLELE